MVHYGHCQNRTPDHDAATPGHSDTTYRQGRIVRIAVPSVVRPVQAQQRRGNRRHQIAHDEHLVDTFGVDVQDRDLAHDGQARLHRGHRLVDVLQDLAVRVHVQRRESRSSLVRAIRDPLVRRTVDLRNV